MQGLIKVSATVSILGIGPEVGRGVVGGHKWQGWGPGEEGLPQGEEACTHLLGPPHLSDGTHSPFPVTLRKQQNWGPW